MEIEKIWFKVGEVSRLSKIQPWIIRYMTDKYCIPHRRNRKGDRKYHKKDVFKYFINGNN